LDPGKKGTKIEPFDWGWESRRVKQLRKGATKASSTKENESGVKLQKKVLQGKKGGGKRDGVKRRKEIEFRRNRSAPKQHRQ